MKTSELIGSEKAEWAMACLDYILDGWERNHEVIAKKAMTLAKYLNHWQVSGYTGADLAKVLRETNGAFSARSIKIREGKAFQKLTKNQELRTKN